LENSADFKINLQFCLDILSFVRNVNHVVCECNDLIGDKTMNRTALIVSITLTAFVLTIFGGVAYTVQNTQKARAAQAAVASQGVDPQVEQALVQREASYQQMIAEANNRLAEAQKAQQDLQAQLTALQNNVQAAPQAAATTATPQQAAQIAAQYLNETSIYSVESLPLNGQPVYKVTFSSGDIAYVSLDGQVLGVQMAPSQANPSNLLASRGGEHENEKAGGDD
jgi:uncharacterized membrane protein